MLDGYSKHCTFPYRPCESCSKHEHDVSAVPEAWRTTPMPSSLFQIRILSTMPVYIPLSPVTRKCFSTSKDSSKDRRSLLLTIAVRFLFSYYFHTFLVIERSNSRELRKQSNKKDLRINIEIFRRGRIRRRR